MDFPWTVIPNGEPVNDLLKTVLIDYKPYVVAANCQTCGIANQPETCIAYAFCSGACFKLAEEKSRCNAIIPIINYSNQPCVVLTIDPNKGRSSAEIPGGKRDEFESQIEGAARECQEEMGLKEKIPKEYLEDNTPRFLLWYQRTRYKLWVNVGVFFLKLKNFSIVNANSACQHRKMDDLLPEEWKETNSMFVIPFRNFSDYARQEAEGNKPILLDVRGREVRNLSPRWKNLLTNEGIIAAMEHFYYYQTEPLVLPGRTKSFVWNHSDLL